MTTPLWILLLFIFWTLIILIGSVGSYRLGMIFSGKAPVRNFSFPDIEKSDWHRRAMRAHLNCVENLPLYAALVLVMVATGISAPLLDRLAVVYFIFRILHTLIHLSFRQTGKVTSIRFLFFTIQLGCLLWMGIYLAIHA